MGLRCAKTIGRKVPIACALRILCSKRRASFAGRLPGAGFDIAWDQKAGKNRMMSMAYQAYQNHMDLTAPWRTGAASALKYLNLVPQGVSDKLFGRLAAALELISRTSLTYARPGLWHRQGAGGKSGTAKSPRKSCSRRRSARCCISRRRIRRRSRACCWWRRCPATSRRCCGRP